MRGAMPSSTLSAWRPRPSESAATRQAITDRTEPQMNVDAMWLSTGEPPNGLSEPDPMTTDNPDKSSRRRDVRANSSDVELGSRGAPASATRDGERMVPRREARRARRTPGAG